MQPTLELMELDSLIDELDAQVSEVSLESKEPASLLCSAVGCGPWPYTHYHGCW